MATDLEQFKSVVTRGVFYDAEMDDHGCRVSTNLSGTPCPRCKVEVEPNVVHVCGHGVKKTAVLGKVRRKR